MIAQLRGGAEYSRFPLVQRPRPAATPLATRVRELRELAAREDEDNAIIRDAEVCNKAALIASDCGLSDLARDLCWRQHEVFARSGPLHGRPTTLALQPLLNLSRQLIRDGGGDGAYAILTDLYRGLRDRTDVVLGERRVSLGHLAGTPDDYQAARTLVWAALLADGTRALILSGRLRDAALHAEACRGVGERLLDGRQAVILARIDDGDVDQATALVEQSNVVEPWERAVQGVLRAYCHLHAQADAEEATARMLGSVLALARQPDAMTTVFRVRLGVTALDLTDNYSATQVSHLRAELISAARSDGYAAREVLANPRLRRAMTAEEHKELSGILQFSGLGARAVPASLRRDLSAAASLAEGRLRALLRQNTGNYRQETGQ
jgi:hypothetical protein